MYSRLVISRARPINLFRFEFGGWVGCSETDLKCGKHAYTKWPTRYMFAIFRPTTHSLLLSIDIDVLSIQWAPICFGHALDALEVLFDGVLAIDYSIDQYGFMACVVERGECRFISRRILIDIHFGWIEPFFIPRLSIKKESTCICRSISQFDINHHEIIIVASPIRSFIIKMNAFFYCLRFVASPSFVAKTKATNFKLKKNGWLADSHTQPFD